MAYKISLIFPKEDNNGKDITADHPYLLERIMDIAGGYTLQDVKGGWKDTEGRMYLDSSIKVDTLVEENATITKLRDLASEACVLLKQECIFFSIQPLDVHFITAPSNWTWDIPAVEAPLTQAVS